MGNGCKKQNDNVYFRCRKEAAEKDSRLSNREGAAFLLGISESTLTDYERGITKVIPVDNVVLMAALYHHPELKNRYCKTECPIGKELPIAVEPTTIERAVIRILQEFNPDRVEEFTHKLVEIAQDGKVTYEEKGMLKLMLSFAYDMDMALSQLKLTAERILES